MINYLTEVARSYNDEQITLICEEIDRSNHYDQKTHLYGLLSQLPRTKESGNVMKKVFWDMYFHRNTQTFIIDQGWFVKKNKKGNESHDDFFQEWFNHQILTPFLLQDELAYDHEIRVGNDGTLFDAFMWKNSLVHILDCHTNVFGDKYTVILVPKSEIGVLLLQKVSRKLSSLPAFYSILADIPYWVGDRCLLIPQEPLIKQGVQPKPNSSQTEPAPESENIKWVLHCSCNDENARNAIKRLSDDDLRYCLEKETRKTGIQNLLKEARSRNFIDI
ncbi:hypothetical protein M2444_004679 [Paenibacillus sp. PastF-3]|uniref:hypothetical protein n=1 Tax=Paenibacillus sp. PastF-3 TaxID=2940626 RepID=UPI0024734F8C|nr:hypothetical protein [Paenibacillus sp. PastF-3]MDH6372850.1 hypothetical protein [Paenibacillus sp. PastF-3]